MSSSVPELSAGAHIRPLYWSIRVSPIIRLSQLDLLKFLSSSGRRIDPCE